MSCNVLDYYSSLLIQQLFAIIASVLHLGNVKFATDALGYAVLKNIPELHWLSKVRLKQNIQFDSRVVKREGRIE